LADPMPSIAELLKQRNAFLKGCGGNENEALARHALLRMIGDDYRAFEPLRDALLNGAGLDAEARRAAESA